MDYNFSPWDHMHGLDLSEEIHQLATSNKFGEDLPAYVDQQQPPQQQQQQQLELVQHASLQQQPLVQQSVQPLVQPSVQNQVQGHTQQVFFSSNTSEASNDSIINEKVFTGLKQENHDVSPVETPHEGAQNTAEFATIINSTAATGQTAFTPGQAQTLVMPGGKHVMLLPNQAMGPNQYFLAAPTIGTQQVMQQQQQHSSGSIDLPAHNDWSGEYDFQVKIEEKERTVKSPMWMMSTIMQKLYTNINKPVPFEVRMHRRPPGVNFNVRATLIFSEQQYMRMNVIRCPNHAAPSDPSNHDFPYPEHVVRCDHPAAKYESHPNGRLSVIVPLDNLQDGMEFTPILLRFMCLGSCVGGINRKYISLILGLEDMSGRTVGRRVVHVRVCACPTRDIKTDELQFQNKGIKRKGSTGLIEKKVPLTKKTKTKEPKLEPADDDDDDQIYYLPVRGRKLYNYLQDMMLVFSRHFPDHARNSSIEAPADDNGQQKPHRSMELKDFGPKNTLYRPKILKSSIPVPEGSSEQGPNVIIQNSLVHKTISEKYSDEVFQHFLNQEVLKRNNIEVDNGTIKAKSVVSSLSTKKIPQQKHIFLKNPAVENVGAKIQLVKTDEKKLIAFSKFSNEIQKTTNNLDIVDLSGQISNDKLELASTGKETLIHMPEAFEERQGTSKNFDVGVLTRHIPVVPITHFIPRTKLIKAKSSPINRVNTPSENIPTISRASTISNISDIRSSLGKNTSGDPEEITYSISESIPTISRASTLSDIRVSSENNTLVDTEESTYSISERIPTISRASSLGNIRVSGKNIYKNITDTYSKSVDIIPHFPSTSLRPTIVQSLSPDSPEMMAANVLISDLKYSFHKEIKKPPNNSGE